MYGLYQSRWGFSSTTLTALFSVYAAGVLVSLLTMGKLSDRHADRRVVILPALGVVALGSLVFAFAPNLTGLFVGRVLTGLGSGALSGVCTAALTDLDAAAGHKPRAALLATLAITAGAALGPLGSAAALQLDVWPMISPFVLGALLAFAAAVGLARLRWPVPLRLPQSSRNDADAAFRSAFRPLRRRFGLACGIVVVAWAVGAAFMAFGPTLARQVMPEAAAGTAGLVVALFQVAAGLR